MLDPSASGDTQDSQLRRILGQESEESDDDTDYIPPGLANFVKQAEATLNNTRETFLSNARSAPPEPAVFCFDGSRRPQTPPMEDEEDIGLRNEVLERFKPKGGNEVFDVEKILSQYSGNAPNASEEVFFSPDLKTPPPNPHFDISNSQARKLALGTPALTVDTDVLPIRPPTHEDSGSSNSVDEEPDEPMDPMSWLDAAFCDKSPEQHGSLEKRPDPPSQPTPQKLEPTPHFPEPMSSPFADMVTPKSQPVGEAKHVGDVDETLIDHPPSSPKHAEVTVDVQAKPQNLPAEVTVPAVAEGRKDSSVPMEVTVEKSSAVEISQPEKSPTQTPDKRLAPTTVSSKENPVWNRLSRPTTAFATRAAAASKMTPDSSSKSTTTYSHRTPTTGKSKLAETGSADRAAPSVKRTVGSVQPPKVPTEKARTTPVSLKNDRKAPSVRKTPPSSSSRTQPVSGSKVARTSDKASPRASTYAPISSARSQRRLPVGASPTEKASQSTARVTRTFKQSQPRAPVNNGNSHTQKASPVLTTKRHSPKSSGVSSRLFQDTTAFRQRHAAAITSQHSHSPSANRSPQDAPGSHISGRLLQETAASKQRHAVEEVAPKPTIQDIPAPPVSSRLLQETTATRFRHAEMEEEFHARESSPKSPSRLDPVPAVPSRLLQETTAWKLHHEAEEELHADTPHVPPEVPFSSRILEPTSASIQKIAAKADYHSTPLKPIATDEAKLQASREKAQERIRQHMERENQRQVLLVSPKYSAETAEEGIARARERVRLRQEKERRARLNEDLGKVSAPRVKRSTFVPSHHQRKKPITIPEGPRLSTSRRQAMHSATPRAQATLVEMTLAQSTDILRKGLRGDDISQCSGASGRRKLTIARSPKFATSARHGEKLSSVGWAEKASLASSTRLLQNQLRGGDLSLTKKRELKLTQPKSPTFHQTSKRALPKSTAEREEEMMKKFNSKPFKAHPYQPLGAPRGVAGVSRKTLSRPSTTPQPFRFHSDRRSTAVAEKSLPQEEEEDAVEMKKKFHARPMTSFANPPKIKKAPRVDTNSNAVHPDRSISPPKLRTSDRAGKRLETVQAFSAHAEQVRQQKGLEQKRRQREKHEEEMRKAQAQLTVQTATLTRAAETPFQLASPARHEQYQRRMEEKLRLQHQQEEKAATFQARQFRPAPAPEVKRRRHPPTKAEPFALESVQRHSRYEEESRKKHEEAVQQVQQKSQFKARPVPQTTYQVTSPASSQPFLLATTARRQAYEEQKKQREEAELEEIRKQAQFKARPVPESTYTYRPISPSQRSPNASPARQRLSGGVHNPNSSPDRMQNGNHLSVHGTQERPIDVDGNPPVPTIVFQS